MNVTSARAAALAATGAVSFAGLDFQLAPMLIGVSAAFLVRVPLYKGKRLLAEASFTAMAMVGAFATIADNRLGPGNAFWCGIMFGAAASSMMEIGRSIVTGAIRARLQAAGRVLFGVDRQDSSTMGGPEQ